MFAWGNVDRIKASNARIQTISLQRCEGLAAWRQCKVQGMTGFGALSIRPGPIGSRALQVMKRWLKVLAVVCVTLLLIGAGYERFSQHSFEATRPPAGEFIELDGRQIHFVKRGHGAPTVVFQSGLGSDWRIWEEVQSLLAEKATTISYDRAGLLWSDPAEGKKTLERIDTELLAVLEKTGCQKPYLLVGHSIAGVTLRRFIATHSNDIAGVVLVDTTPIDLLSGSPSALRPYFDSPPRPLVALSVYTGLIRAVLSVKPFVSSLPVGHWFNRHVRDSFSRSWVGVMREAEDDDGWFEQAIGVTSFGDVPLVVISAAYPNGVGFLTGKPALAEKYLEYHHASEEALLRLSSHSRLIWAWKSDHYVPLQEPQLIADAVASLLQTAQEDSR